MGLQATGTGWPAGLSPWRPSRVVPQTCVDGSCATDSGGSEGQVGEYPFVYAIGSIAVRFPSLGVEKEFVQATGRRDTAGLTGERHRQTVDFEEGTGRWRRRRKRVRHGYFERSIIAFGSNASRRPSPTRLIERIRTTRKPLGK